MENLDNLFILTSFLAIFFGVVALITAVVGKYLEYRYTKTHEPRTRFRMRDVK